MPGIELTWPNKGRVLYRVPQRGGERHKPVYFGGPDAAPNRLILGDNADGVRPSFTAKDQAVHAQTPFLTMQTLHHLRHP